MAEVVSPYELQYAQALEFAPTAIVYNGAIPDLEGKYYIATNHGIVNIDNYEEFAALRERAEERHEPIRLGLRVNLDVGNGEVSRFGLIRTVISFRRLCRRYSFMAKAPTTKI